jgi:hypothetical protein
LKLKIWDRCSSLSIRVKKSSISEIHNSRLMRFSYKIKPVLHFIPTKGKTPFEAKPSTRAFQTN